MKIISLLLAVFIMMLIFNLYMKNNTSKVNPSELKQQEIYRKSKEDLNEFMDNVKEKYKKIDEEIEKKL